MKKLFFVLSLVGVLGAGLYAVSAEKVADDAMGMGQKEATAIQDKMMGSDESNTSEKSEEVTKKAE